MHTVEKQRGTVRAAQRMQQQNNHGNQMPGATHRKEALRRLECAELLARGIVERIHRVRADSRRRSGGNGGGQ